MEHRLGWDFSNVRIHRGREAAASAQAFDARAYTVGHHIVFAPGHYDPASAKGQHILAHELAHVIQQRRGPVSGLSIGDDIKVSQPNDSFERAAEKTAWESMAEPGTLRPGNVTPGFDRVGAKTAPLSVQSAPEIDDDQSLTGDSTPVADGGGAVTDDGQSLTGDSTPVADGGTQGADGAASISDDVDCQLAERAVSTKWGISSDVSGSLGGYLAGSAMGFALWNVAAGTVHPLLFVGGGLGYGGKGNKKPKPWSKLPVSIGNPGFTEFDSDPHVVGDFGGWGAVGSAGAAVIIGWSETFVKLPVSTSPAIIRASGIQLGLGASATLTPGYFKTISGYCRSYGGESADGSPDAINTPGTVG
jgi:hypothetical protein